MLARIQLLDYADKFCGTSNPRQDLEEKLPVYTVKLLGEINKSDVEVPLLFPALFHDLTQGEDFFNCASTASVA